MGVEAGDAFRVLGREVRSGLILGSLLAVCAFAIALAWSTTDVAVTVALSIGAVSVWGNILGAALPLLAERLNLDPALVSGPLLTTIIDVTGLLIYFTIARLVLAI